MTRQLVFSVPDMQCGACVRSITEALHRLDAAAEICADLTAKTVNIATRSTADFGKAIEDAGFTVTVG